MNSTIQSSMIQTLEQAVTLLENLTQDQYIESVPSAFHSCIGSHYRHSLEHFEAILTEVSPTCIDYDARERNPNVETDVNVALKRTRIFLERARNLPPSSMETRVRVRCSVSADPESPVVDSSLGREGMYAVIHAIHHYAIIRMMCHLLEIELPEGFGVAPSTLQYRKTLADQGG